MKAKIFIMLIGGILMCALTSIATYFGLSSAGVIKGSTIDLIYATEKMEYEMPYTGQKIVANDDICPYKLIEGKLLDGHIEYFDYSGEIIDVGSVNVTAKVTILNDLGYDVTSEYNIKVNPTKITVKEREITVSIDSKKIVYSGQEVNASNDLLKVVEGELAKGDRLVPSVSLNQNQNGFVVSADVYDVYGNNKNENYKIKFDGNENEIAIAKLPLIIEPVSTSKEYDGKPLVFSDYRIKTGTLLTNHHLEIDYGEGITDVDESGSNFKIAQVYVLDSDGEDVSQYYNIDFSTTANLTIRPVKIAVKVNNISKVYDGSGFGDDDISKTNLYSYNLPDTFDKEKYVVDMINYESIKTKLLEMKNVTEESFDCKFALKNGDSFVNDANYELIITQGSYSISPCYAHVTFKNLGKFEYDGNGVQVNDPLEIVDNFYLDSKSSVSAYDEFEKLEICFADVDNAIGYFRHLSEIGRYWYNVDLKLYEYTIENGVETLKENSNFRIIYENRGVVEITPIKLLVVGLSDQLEYNGEKQKLTVNDLGKTYEAIEGNILPNHVVNVTYNNTLKDVGVVDCHLKEIKITYGTIDVTNYYEITYIAGTLEILPRKLMVRYKMQEGSVLKYIYGDIIDVGEYGPTIEGVLPSDNRYFYSVQINQPYMDYEPGSPIGTYEIEYSGLVVSPAIKDNYEVVYISTFIEIIAKPVEVEWGNDRFVYDGEYHIPTCKVKTGQLLEDDECEVVLCGPRVDGKRTSGRQINANKTEDTHYTVYVESLSNPNYVLSALAISSKAFFIDKAPLTININDCTKEYNENRKNNGYSIEGMVGNDTEKDIKDIISGSEAVSFTYFSDKNPYNINDDLYITLNIDNEKLADSLLNYYIKKVNNGLLTTNPAKLPVVTVSFDKATITYGEPLNAEYLNKLIETEKILLECDDESFNIDELNFDNVRAITTYKNSNGQDCGKYPITLAGIEFTNGVKLYDFDYVEGEIEVLKCAVGVDFSQAIDPIHFQYRGKDISFSTNDFVVNYGLVNNVRTDTLGSFTIVNACVGTNSDIDFTEYIKFYDNNGRDVTANYDISCACIIRSSNIEQITLTFDYKVIQIDYFSDIESLLSPNLLGNGFKTLYTSLASGDTLTNLSVVFNKLESSTDTVWYYNAIISECEICNANGDDISFDYYEYSSIVGMVIITNCPSS